jgi:platelet-activating factor acetylhydrolase IB subunit beta/gamma
MLRFLGALFAFTSRPAGGRARSRRRVGGPRWVRPRLEALEDRQMLSANPATLPVPGFGFVRQGENTFAKEPKGDPGAVFLGDSILFDYGYAFGAPVWNTAIAPSGAEDFAVPGQTTQNLLFQLGTGILSGLSPSVVVLDIGANNLLLEHQTPAQTAGGVVADVQAIQALEPQASIVVLGLLPQAPSNPYGLPPASPGEIDQTNSLISQQLAGMNNVQFVNADSSFLQANGSIAPGTLVDGLHPSTTGSLLLTQDLLGPFTQAAVAGELRSSVIG